MNRTTALRIAPAIVALALAVSGCSGESADETPSPGQSANEKVCEGYSDLQKSVDDLKATPLDTTGTLEEIQAQAGPLSAKAATVQGYLTKLSAVSDGPVAAAIGEFNKKADALKESLTVEVTDAQEDIGPKITAAQEELTASYAALSTELDKVCPS